MLEICAELAGKTQTHGCHSRSRGKDILNTLINVYNEAAIAEKNEVAVNTAAFINERLDIIEMELGNVECIVTLAFLGFVALLWILLFILAMKE